MDMFLILAPFGIVVMRPTELSIAGFVISENPNTIIFYVSNDLQKEWINSKCKLRLETFLKERLNNKYAELGLSAKISGQITSVVGKKKQKKTSFFAKLRKAFSKKVLSKISKKFDYKVSMQESLENLSSINPLFGINLKNLKSYNNMFEGCQKIY
jgi:chromosomal replication initiation ATPase DnaA